ncbi:DUF6382 domain-containing protein [Neobacillus niacini]|uniref:DUF6382 domain-containing protein n=1 Tax=Neobacillus niacini TaxID=86668 RepID=UPI0028634956|nr:DUF6382 domain-containing protein [Neobacillus niacini]MDR6999324.1 hypothetical protein [Neobacillus niacini]
MIRNLDLSLEDYGFSKFFYYPVPNGMELDMEMVADRAETDLLTNNKLRISGLLPFGVVKRDGAAALRYDMISPVNLEQLFASTLSKEQLVATLLKMMEGLEDLEKNGLDLEKILLNKKYIFLDDFSNRLVFLYVPVKVNVFEKVSMNEFLKTLIADAPYDEADDLLFFIKLHNYLVKNTDLPLLHFKEALKELAAGIAGPLTETNKGVPQAHFYSPSQGNMISEAAAAVEEGTTVLGSVSVEEEEGTTALGVGPHTLAQPFLLEAATGEKISLTKAVFKLGRDPEQVDFVAKNKVVGRVHAEILTVNGEYFFVDKQSRNGSYLNGVRLVQNSKTKLKHEDKIKLANEEFVFRLF